MSENTPSTKTMPTIVKCPTCQKDVEWSEKSPHRPFCSERCKLIDFGDWADESNRIAGNPTYDDVMGEDLDY